MGFFLLSLAACLIAVNCNVASVDIGGEDLFDDYIREESNVDEIKSYEEDLYVDDGEEILEDLHVGGVKEYEDYSWEGSQHFNVVDGKAPEDLNVGVRRNEVVIAVYAGISEATAVVGKESLENLVSANADNGAILDSMYSLFSGLNRDLDWHLTFQTTSYGATPTAYVYYLFDRNNTELLVAGYKRCA